MKLVPLADRHVSFVAASFYAGTGMLPRSMPEDTKIVVAEADETDADGEPVFLGWAGVSAGRVVWTYVRVGAVQKTLRLDEVMLKALGLDLPAAPRVRALFDGSVIRTVAKRYGWELDFV